MKLPQCICFLLLIVASHQVLAHAGGRCGNDKYWNDGICCNLCPAGTHFVADCTRSTDTVCKPCEEGITYTAFPNRLQGCIKCKHCDGHVGLVVKPGGACVRTNNTQCQCREGMFHPHESSQVCVYHSLCPKGEQVAKEGTPYSDTVCEPCPYGTFSNRESLTKCRPWRNCTALGMKTVRNGTSTRNARCEEFSTTSTEKPPITSETVTPAPKVNSTTVNVRPTSSSTSTTVTYRSTALRMTAAPTSTIHPSTTVTKPPVQQTTTQSTMTVTPPFFDNNPGGGYGPNHHGNTAQIAIAAVVGVIAVLFGLFGFAYFVPKLFRRRRRRRRPNKYDPVLLPSTSGTLEVDQSLQGHDLEGQLHGQLLDDNAGRDEHAGTTAGATPGDNTCPHEMDAFIQPQRGTLHEPYTGGVERIPAINITDEHLTDLADEMPNTWQKIGMKYFQIRTQDIDKLKTKHPRDRDMQIVEMFKIWLGRNGKAANLRDLCKKLNDAGIEWSVLHKLFSEGKTQPKVFG